jgi:hypothetical protein
MARTQARRRPRRAARYALSATTLIGLAWTFGIPAASAATVEPVRAGDAVIVEGNDGSGELTHGKSATQFSLRLPQGAACPGDSANDQWRFQSFMVPASDTPDTLHYNVNGPDGPGQFALFQVSTSPLVDVLTNQNAVPGEPGVIPALPPMSFAAFPPGLLPAGTYRIGIACTLARQTANYWDTEIVITSSPSDKPSQFVWRLASVPANVDDSHPGSSAWLIPVGLAVLGAAALAWFFWRRPTRVAVNRRRVPNRARSRAPARNVIPRSTNNKVTSGSTHGAVTHSKEPQ